MKFLKHGPEILVGTPGRVIDLLDRRIINFDNIRFVVLDEVDRMLDIGFRDDIRNILSRVKGVRRTRRGEQRNRTTQRTRPERRSRWRRSSGPTARRGRREATQDTATAAATGHRHGRPIVRLRHDQDAPARHRTDDLRSHSARDRRWRTCASRSKS